MLDTNKPVGFSRDDRDLLIELRTNVAALRQDIYSIKDNISANVTDHETRIRSLEVAALTFSTEKASSDRFTRLGGTVLIFVVGVVEFLVSHFIK